MIAKIITVLFVSLLPLQFSCTDDIAEEPQPVAEADAGMATLPPATKTTCPSSKPKRLVVMGDSINACFGLEGLKDDASCGPKQFHSYLQENHFSEIQYNNIAVSGSVMDDVIASQLPNVAATPEPLLVLLYIGGNNLQPILISTDESATLKISELIADYEVAWETIFSYFDNKEMFPGGVTLMMNNQYNPFDDCSVGPFAISPTKIALLDKYNQFLSNIAARHSNAWLTNQHANFLGHGHNFEIGNCPHTKEVKAKWLGDIIHPNAIGHTELSKQWIQSLNAEWEECQF